MRVYVSRADITEGLKTMTSNSHCPIARAIKRATKKKSVLVGVDWYMFAKKYALEKERRLPPSVTAFINNMCEKRFDLLEPFSFSI